MVRLKHRYLLVNILYPEASTSSAHPKLATSTDTGRLPWTVIFHRPSADNASKLFLRMIRDAVGEVFGDYGSGMTVGSLKIIYFSPATSTAIIRAPRAHFRLLWAALSLITRMPHPINEPCVLQVVRVSGTIRKIEEEAIRRARIHIRMAESNCAGVSQIGSVLSTKQSALPQALEDFYDDAESNADDG